jgi:hypothetical protein
MNLGKEGRKMLNELVKSKDLAIFPVTYHPAHNFVLNVISEKYFQYQDAVDLGSSFFMSVLLTYVVADFFMVSLCSLVVRV